MTEKTDDTQEELQRLYIQQQILKHNMSAYSEQKNIIEAKLMELNSTINAIAELKTSGKEILANLGSNVMIKSEIKDNENVIIEIGADIYGKKNLDDAISVLNERRDELIDTNNKIMMEINKMNVQLMHIEPEMQKLVEKMNK